MRSLVLIITALVMGAWPAAAQSVISAKAGLVHYTEGVVTVDGQPAEHKIKGKFVELATGQELKTEEGRAEVLLTPGSTLRLAEHSSLRMLSTTLMDVRFELLSGSALIECGEMQKDQAMTATAGEYALSIRAKGLYRIDRERVRVYEGEAVLAGAGQSLTLRKGRLALLGPVLTAEKFDPKVGDELYRWAARRSEQFSLANLSAAHSLYQSGAAWNLGGWYWNPWFNMFTYVPLRGQWLSPFGYTFFNPGRAYQVITVASRPTAFPEWNRAPYFDGNRGYTVTSRSDGFGGRVSVAPPTVGGAGASSPRTVDGGADRSRGDSSSGRGK